MNLDEIGRCIDQWLRRQGVGVGNVVFEERGCFRFFMYDAFCFFYDDRPRLQLGDCFGEPIELTTFFGETPTGTTEAEIIHALEVVNEYCRLRLPDKYLEAYERNA